MEPIYYIANYPCFEEEHYRDANKAAALQSEYLAQVLSELGYNVSIVSTAIPDSGCNLIKINSRFNRTIAGNVKVVYFTWLNSKNTLLCALGLLLYNHEVKSFIKNNDGIYLVYHSRLHYKINRWIKRYRRKL